MGKVATKFLVRRIVGEPYVGKRMKFHYLSELLQELNLKVNAALEVGCSDGLFTHLLRRKFPSASITGVDIDEENIAELKAFFHDDAKIHFVCNDIVQTSESNKYDLIFALDVLEHIVEDDVAITKMYDALRPGGTLIVHVPNKSYQTIDGKIHDVADEDAWKINPGHVRQGYSPAALADKLQKAGFTVNRCFTSQGWWADVAHRSYQKFEKPAFLRLGSIPITDVCSFLDRKLPRSFGNTVFAVAVKSAECATLRDTRSQFE